MGTSGSYGGSGGQHGRALRREIRRWLDDIASSAPPDTRPASRSRSQAPIRAAVHALGMFRSRSSTSSGGATGGGGNSGARFATRRSGRTSGGAQRSVAISSRSAGRAAAAAYAYSTANASVLSDLGLDYDELRQLRDPLEVSCRIVDAACGPWSASTIDHEEQRWVAAKIADWVFTEEEAGALPEPDEIARKAIAFIIFEAIASEAGALMNESDHSDWSVTWSDEELSDAAEVLASRAALSVNGVTHSEFEESIEDGINALREIYGMAN